MRPRIAQKLLLALLVSAPVTLPTSALAEPPPLVTGSDSPYDALLPYAPPFPTSGLLHHFTGRWVCPTDQSCTAPDGSTFSGPRVESQVPGRGQVLDFPGGREQTPSRITSRGNVIEFYNEVNSPTPQGFTIAGWFKSRGRVSHPNPLWSVPSLSLVLDHGIPALLSPSGESFDERDVLDPDADRLDDERWHHVALTVQLVCNGYPDYFNCLIQQPYGFPAVARIYVNGSLRQEGLIVLAPAQIEGPEGPGWGIAAPTFGVGRIDSMSSPRFPDGDVTTSGLLDDVFVYRRALSNEEVVQLQDRAAMGLVWMLDDRTSPTPLDLTPITRPDGMTRTTFSAIVPSAERDLLASSTALMNADLRPLSPTRTTLMWVKPSTGGIVDVLLRRGASDATSESALGLRFVDGHARLLCGQAQVGAPLSNPSVGADEILYQVGTDARTWQVLAFDQEHDLDTLRVFGREARTFDRFAYRTTCPLDSGTTGHYQTVQITSSGPTPNQPLHVGWIAEFDRLLTPSEQLAWSSPGPAVWVRQDFTQPSQPTLRRLSDRTTASYYPATTDECETAGRCTRASFQERLTSTSWNAAVWNPLTLTASTATTPGQAAGVRVPLAFSELGSRVNGRPVPFTTSVRFVLTKGTSTTNTTRRLTLFRRQGWVADRVAHDVIARLTCNNDGCFRLDLKVPDLTPDGFVTERFFSVETQLPWGAHTISVAWRPGWTRAVAQDAPPGQDAPVTFVARPRIAIDGVPIGGEEGAAQVVERTMDDPTLTQDRHFYEGVVPVDYDSWLLGVSKQDNSDIGMKLLEARVYGREIEAVEWIASACKPDTCGELKCHGLTDLADERKVGSPTCGECKDGYLPAAHFADGRAAECALARQFNEECDANIQCASGMCLDGYCTAETGRATATSECAQLGRVFDPDVDGRFGLCGACLADYAPIGAPPRGAYDPRTRCAPSVNIADGARCERDTQCESGLCVFQYQKTYGVDIQAARQSANLTDSTDCGAFDGCYAEKTYEWESLDRAKAAEGNRQVKVCAAQTEAVCAARGEVAVKAEDVVSNFPHQTEPEPLYYCGNGAGQCLSSYQTSWTVLSPQACATLYQNALTMKSGPKTLEQVQAAWNPCQTGSCSPHWGAVPTWEYAEWKKDFLTGGDNLSAKRLMDMLWQGLTGQPAKASYSANDYSELERLGAGPLLLEYITQETEPAPAPGTEPETKTGRSKMRQAHGLFLPLGMCANERTTYTELGATTALATYPSLERRAYTNGSNVSSCVPKRQDDGSPCPLPDAVSTHDGHSFCKSRYCAADTGVCAQGGHELSQTGADTGNDHNSGKMSVKFGLIRCDDTTLEIMPDCDHTRDTCRDGIDNDKDGVLDDDDGDCWLVMDGTRTIRESLAIPGQCSDRIDNDNDGLTDMAEKDCDIGKAFFAGEQPACEDTENEGEWRYVMNTSNSANLCMFGHLFPPVPIVETSMMVDHSKGAACGSSSARFKVVGISLNLPAKPLFQCTGMEIELDPECRDAGGDRNLAPGTGCEINAEEFATSLLSNPGLQGAVCIPLPEDFEDSTTYKHTFKELLVPIAVSVGLTFDACLEFYVGLNADADGNGLPMVELKPIIAIGADARAGLGLAEQGVPVEIWAGARLSLTFASLAFPIRWLPTLEVSCYDDNSTQDDKTIACTAQTSSNVVKKLLLEAVLKMQIDMEIEFLSGSFGLFAELTIGPFSIEKTWDIFAWTGIKYIMNLFDKELDRFKIDFEFDPLISTELGGEVHRCDGECE